ncbi:MAG: 2-amino-4-hydroxy-6-hydroxymethyldihydropteridine diphosphokinase [Nitrososphaerota archaeon]|nr:2-amino-4-hydroxy-6-hydroxymethyldihydropteridine diphosphokinase [Nitrososphaerota archaeon]
MSTPTPHMDKIIIEGLKACGKHGVLDFERQYPQSFTVDIEIWADISKSYLSDDLEDTVNYAGVYDIIKTTIETQSFRLIERLSYVIIEKIFHYNTCIQKIKIRVIKDKAPLNGQVDSTGVEIEKSRDTTLMQDADVKTNIDSEIGANTNLEADEGYKAVLALGSNIGDRYQNIQKTLEMLSESTGINILNRSNLYETEPVGYVEQEKFYNAAILVETTLNPFELYSKVKDIENNLGRKKTFRWGPRLIDIDIIAYERCVINTKGLTLPHKEYMQRAFVLKPLSDMPDAVEVAGLNMTLIEKMTECADDYQGLKCIGPL